MRPGVCDGVGARPCVGACCPGAGDAVVPLSISAASSSAANLLARARCWSVCAELGGAAWLTLLLRIAREAPSRMCRGRAC